MREWQRGVLVFAAFPNITARLSSPPPARRIPPKNPKISRFSAHLAIVFSLPAERVSFRGSACHLSDRFHVCTNYTCVNIISFSLFCKDLFYISPRKKPACNGCRRVLLVLIRVLSVKKRSCCAPGPSLPQDNSILPQRRPGVLNEL